MLYDLWISMTYLNDVANAHTHTSALSKPIGGSYNSFKARTKRVFCKSSRKPSLISMVPGFHYLTYLTHQSVVTILKLLSDWNRQKYDPSFTITYLYPHISMIVSIYIYIYIVYMVLYSILLGYILQIERWSIVASKPKLQTPSLGQVIGPAIAKGAGQHGAPTCPSVSRAPLGVNKE
jgi:hypothetical protein